MAKQLILPLIVKTDTRFHCCRSRALGFWLRLVQPAAHTALSQSRSCVCHSEHCAALAVAPKAMAPCDEDTAPFPFMCKLYCFFWSPGNDQEIVRMKTLHREWCYLILSSVEVGKYSQKLARSATKCVALGGGRAGAYLFPLLGMGRQLVMLNDLSILLRWSIAHPDPTKVVRSLTHAEKERAK